MQYTSKFSGEEIDSILDNVESKQNKSTLVGDLATKVNALSASDKASFLGKIGAMPATMRMKQQERYGTALERI